MKKMISIFLVVACLISISVPTFASSKVEDEDITTFSFYNDESEIVTITTSFINGNPMAKVYVEGVLTQKSIAVSDEETILTEVYDLPIGTDSTDSVEDGTIGDFTNYTVHAPISTETIQVESIMVSPNSIFDEPVDNTGLSPSVYGDGYYFLGSYGGHPQAPGVRGYLFRTYTKKPDGYTKYWSINEGMFMSAFVTYLAGLPKGIVGVIVNMVSWTAKQVVAYTQAVNLETYTFDYNYRVRVNGTIYYTANRNITYWYVENITNNDETWEQKSFNSGFSLDNGEMVLCGLDNYALST